MSNGTLYLCYFGLREPLVQTQVLPYLREIEKLDGLKVSLLTFEPELRERWAKDEIKSERGKLAREGINWHCLPYHKRPSVPATLFDILNGALFTWRLVHREDVNILHARVHVPAMMAAIVKTLSRRKLKLLFDIRGFFPEEYTDAGVWKENGFIYKVVKRIEKWLMKESDGFVVLTEKARQVLFPESKATGFDNRGRPVEVIPCCVDVKRFETASETSRSEVRRKYNLVNRQVVVYVGSFGGWYMTNEMVDFFGTARSHDPSTFALVITQSNAEIVAALLQKRDFTSNDYLVIKASPAEIPPYLNASDIAISFIKACYSKQASSPTKIAEYLSAGLPIISNSGVGDLDDLIEGEKVGVLLREFSKKEYLEALRSINDLKAQGNTGKHCREIAVRYFGLYETGGENYRKLYRRLLTGHQGE